MNLRINGTLKTGAVGNRTYRTWGTYRITELFRPAGAESPHLDCDPRHANYSRHAGTLHLSAVVNWLKSRAGRGQTLLGNRH